MRIRKYRQNYIKQLAQVGGCAGSRVKVPVNPFTQVLSLIPALVRINDKTPSITASIIQADLETEHIESTTGKSKQGTALGELESELHDPQ